MFSTILICQSPPLGITAIGEGALSSLPLQKGQVGTCGRASCGAGGSSFFGRMLRAVATSTDSVGTIGLILISRISFFGSVFFVSCVGIFLVPGTLSVQFCVL
jgi:hypothetical protein